MSTDDLKEFNEEALKEMTNNFDTLIGEGGYAKVFRGTWNYKPVAVKATTDDSMYEAEKNFLIKLRDCSHIIKLYGYGKAMINDETKDRYCLVLDRKRRNLAELLQGSRLDWKTTLNILHQLATAIESIGSKKFVVGDIKPENILVDEQFNVYLIDFGSAREVGKRIPCFSPGYSAAEVAKLAESTKKAGVYCFGVILLELIMEPGTEIGEVPTSWKNALKELETLRGRAKKVQHQVHISTRVWFALQNRKHVVDKVFMVGANSCNNDDAFTISELGKACTHHDEKSRPSIDDAKKIIEQLQSRVKA